LGHTAKGTAALWVTPSLYVGGQATVPSTDVRTVGEAVKVILDGGTAHLPEDAWDLAEVVLARFGVKKERIAEKIHFAQTGEMGS
jgi:hypothetical protein